MLVAYLASLVVASLLFPTTEAQNPWNDPTKNQYHIQTDEGPERYFRYQTQNGQYRKEKRLQDGTVVGTYAWIDGNGFLIQRDYIADQAGYRIINDKNVFVGKNVNVGEAVKATKKVTFGRKTKPIRLPTTQYLPVTQRPYLPSYPSYVEISPNAISSTIQPPSISSTESPFKAYLPSSSLEVNDLGVGYTSSERPRNSYSTAPPMIYLPSSTSRPETSSVYIQPVSSTLEPPIPSSTYLPSVSTTPSSIYLPSSTPSIVSITPSSKQYIPQINVNSLDYEEQNPYVHQNGPTYPLDKNGHSFNPKYYKIGNGYEAQYPYYNGISVTNDGFRYYIPRAYHEEQNLGYDKKSGSFGYIDPFGIRRVIYYNAGPDGFKHRKNNRYVGFDATPYDPRPYR